MGTTDGDGTPGTDGETRPGSEGPEPDGEDTSTIGLGTVLRLAAWVVGPLLILLGAFGMPTAPVAGATYVVVGLFVTPRTRREIKDLCRIWVEGDPEH